MVKLNKDPYCWQGPGGSKPFDCKLKDWKRSKLTKRYIYVLKFLNENKHSETVTFENQNEFNDILCKYLDFNKINRPTKPTPAHFYTPFQFVGFIGKNNFENSKRFELYITQSGQKFLKEIEHENFGNALNIYLNELFDTKFPNDATDGVVLNLYPVRIMFKLLYERKKIPKFMFLTDIQFIKTNMDLEHCLMLLEDESYLSKISDLESLRKNNKVEFKNLNLKLAKDKWNSYVNGGLMSLGILDKACFREGYIKLSKEGERFVKEKNISEIDYKSFFLDNILVLFNFDNMKILFIKIYILVTLYV